MIRILLYICLCLLLFGCESSKNNLNPENKNIYMGSAISENVLVDVSQFSNETVKLRVRNTSGEQLINKNSIYNDIENELKNLGYNINNKDYSSIIDINIYGFSSISNAQQNPNSGLGMLLGALAGSEISNRNDAVSKGTSIILGAVVGYTIEQIVKNNSIENTYIMGSEISISSLNNNNQNSIKIGGVSIKDDEISNNNSLNVNNSLNIAIYGGSKTLSKSEILNKMQFRLSNIISNIF